MVQYSNQKLFMSITLVKSYLLSLSSLERKKTSERFFKMGRGEYAENDVFIGVKTPDIRKIAKEYKNLTFEALKILISSKIHEERALALLIMIEQYDNNPDEIYHFYLDNMIHINNWDLVDISAHYIVGRYLMDKDRAILHKLAKSQNLWERRIAIVSTWWFIRQNDFSETICLAEFLLSDKHDLIHKAIGWMLREVGKKDLAVLLKFLDQHHKIMPRTSLRYAIEKLDIIKRKHYLKTDL